VADPETERMEGKPKLVITRRLPQAVEDTLAAEFDTHVNRDDEPFDADALRNAFAEADGVLCTVTDRIVADVLAVRPMRARILANFGVGHDHIDVTAAKAAGLLVTNTPGVLTDSTADLTMALILMVMRRCGEGEREVRAGRWTGWRPTHMLGTQVTGKTLGIIGFGRIGRAVAARARHGFGMRVLFHTRTAPHASDVAETGAEARDSIDALLEECDVVSMHCPATPATRHLLDRTRIARMKPGAFVINTARGGIVDEEALIEALRSGELGGAGLDVYDGEPRVHEGLRALDNVVLLPHLGSSTVETRVAMGMRAVANLRAFFAGGTAPDRVA
jgi:lactate dehydrogenase-like 2-hydroxyacid dehydrogenase